MKAKEIIKAIATDDRLMWDDVLSGVMRLKARGIDVESSPGILRIQAEDGVLEVRDSEDAIEFVLRRGEKLKPKPKVKPEAEPEEELDEDGVIAVFEGENKPWYICIHESGSKPCVEYCLISGVADLDEVWETLKRQAEEDYGAIVQRDRIIFPEGYELHNVEGGIKVKTPDDEYIITLEEPEE